MAVYMSDGQVTDLHQQLQRHLEALVPGACLQAQAPPGIPELPLWLLGDIRSGTRLDSDCAAALMETPPYWSFCWASGQVLARWLLDRPALLQGKTVLDVGPGSGVVALAAAYAGAARVLACDIDPQALAAVQLNAASLGLTVELRDDLDACLKEADLVTAADILYDRDNLALLARFQRAPQVILADSRVRNLSAPGYRRGDVLDAVTWPDLDESREFNRVTLYHYDSSQSAQNTQGH